MAPLANVKENVKPILMNASVEEILHIVILSIFVKIQMLLMEIVNSFATRIIRVNVCVVVYKQFSARRITFVTIFLLKSEIASRIAQ